MKALTGKDNGLSAIREAKKQLSLDLDDSLLTKVKSIAIRDGISPNDVIRRIMGLSSKQAKRPRISVSLTGSEMESVASEMNIDPNDTVALKQLIKERIQSEEE